MENPAIHNASLFIEAIAMPAFIGLVVGLIAGKLLRTLALLAIVGLVIVVGLALAGIAHIDSGSLDSAKASAPLLHQLTTVAWQHARTSPPCIMGACIGVALRILIRARTRA